MGRDRFAAAAAAGKKKKGGAIRRLSSGVGSALSDISSEAGSISQFSREHFVLLDAGCLVGV